MGKSSGYSRGVSSGEGEDSPPKALAPASAADAVDELVEAEVSRQRELQVADAGARESPGRRLCRLRVAKFVLVATGVWWGVCMQLIYYQGGGNEMTQLPNVDWYLGMMLVYAGRIFKRGRPEGVADVSQRHILPIAVCDFLGTVGTTIGLELAGSAIFGIIFASVTVWSALFAYAVLGRPQSMLQMAGIGCVVIGLSLPAMESSTHPGADSDGDGVQDESAVHVGIVLTSVGTLFYAAEYVLCERVYTLYAQPVDAKQLCFWTGVWGLTFTSVWLAAYTLPNWHEIVSQEVEREGGSPPLLLLLYFSHMLNNSAHNLAWFVVCELEGGVSTGLLMGLKAAFLFFFSAAFFCDELLHPEQCLTPAKLTGTVVVLVGTAVYYGGCDRLCNALFKSRAAGEKHGGTQLLDGAEFDAIECARVGAGGGGNGGSGGSGGGNGRANHGVASGGGGGELPPETLEGVAGELAKAGLGPEHVKALVASLSDTYRRVAFPAAAAHAAEDQAATAKTCGNGAASRGRAGAAKVAPARRAAPPRPRKGSAGGAGLEAVATTEEEGEEEGGAADQSDGRRQAARSRGGSGGGRGQLKSKREDKKSLLLAAAEDAAADECSDGEGGGAAYRNGSVHGARAASGRLPEGGGDGSQSPDERETLRGSS